MEKKKKKNLFQALRRPPINWERSEWGETVRIKMSANNLDVRGKWACDSRRSTKVYRGGDSQQPRFVPALSGQNRLTLETQLFLLSFHW